MLIRSSLHLKISRESLQVRAFGQYMCTLVDKDAFLKSTIFLKFDLLKKVANKANSRSQELYFNKHIMMCAGKQRDQQ